MTGNHLTIQEFNTIRLSKYSINEIRKFIRLNLRYFMFNMEYRK